MNDVIKVVFYVPWYMVQCTVYRAGAIVNSSKRTQVGTHWLYALFPGRRRRRLVALSLFYCTSYGPVYLNRGSHKDVIKLGT